MSPRVENTSKLLDRGDDQTGVPQPQPAPAGVPEPEDVPFPGSIGLEVDATDTERRILRVRETIPVAAAGEMLLLYPKWLPGFHAPQAPIELFAGLVITAAGETLTWIRHPTVINAFHVDVPAGADAIVAEFQFLSPTAPSQGRVVVSPDLLLLQWNTVLLYPAGHYARQIAVVPTLTLQEGWTFASALEVDRRDGATCRFAPTPLDVLVDSPVLAARHLRREPLDDTGSVHLAIAADQPHLLAATPDQIAAHRSLVEQADRLFRARHFDRFEMLLALSEELTSIGVEHHRSFEAVSIPDYFTSWDTALVRRDTVPHEYIHSWNGKHRRGADSWQPCFERAIRNSLMWVYEGLTQYWTNILCARAGLWSADQTTQALAQVAARYEVRPGSRWRPTIDTTRDPIIAARAPLPWPSWQRSEDYYGEGALIWLDVDTRLRELTGDTRSLDDFARAFFGRNDGVWTTDTYNKDEVVETLAAIAPFDWAKFFEEQLNLDREGAPLAGLARGGWRLVYRDTPSEYELSTQGVSGRIDLTHSLGLTLSTEGELTDVLWEGPAFAAGLTIGARLVAVNDRTFTVDTLHQAIAAAGGKGPPITVGVTKGRHARTVTIPYAGGLRFPHLERIEGTRDRLGNILAPL